MPDLSYTAVFEQAEDGTWSGYIPDLPLVLATGSSKAEAIADMHIALALWMEEMKARRQPIPVPSTEVVSIEVAA